MGARKEEDDAGSNKSQAVTLHSLKNEGEKKKDRKE